MRWSEVITVRSVGNSRETTIQTLRELIFDSTKDPGCDEMRVFRREKLDTDICIVLFHTEEKTNTGGSLLGLRLVNALKELGIVHHVVWIEWVSKSKSTL